MKVPVRDIESVLYSGPGLLPRVRRVLAARPKPPPQSLAKRRWSKTAGGPHPRQEEVTLLVASGLTNAPFAGALAVSRNTVANPT